MYMRFCKLYFFVTHSTISSGLSALAAVVLEDVIKAYFFKDLSENAATNTSKVLGRCLSSN